MKPMRRKNGISDEFERVERLRDSASAMQDGACNTRKQALFKKNLKYPPRMSPNLPE